MSCRAKRSIELRFGIILLIALFTTLTNPAPTDAAPPNIVLIVADDQRPDTIHALGNKQIETPHLDRLVQQGTRFTRAIVAVPICVASRAELLTGRDGLFNGLDDDGFHPKPNVPHLATLLQDAGYDTCYVGKWHTRGSPSASGYQQTRAMFAGGGGRHPLTHPVDWKGMAVTGYRGWVLQTEGGPKQLDRGVGLTPNISETFADAANEFLADAHDRPFFLHVNFTAPHDPLLLPDGYADRYDPATLPLPPNFRTRHPFDHGNFRGRDEVLYHWPRTAEETRHGLAVYYAVISHLDAQVGRILQTIEDRKMAESTVAIYTSDHGLAMGSHGLRGKQNMYEHTIGIPLIVRGPGIAAGRTSPAPCYLRDLFATLCELGGAAMPGDVQSISLLPVLMGEPQQVRTELYAHFRDSQRMVRLDPWKYVVYPQQDREQLFRLDHDPHELHNLANEASLQPVRQRLAHLLNQWRMERDDPTLPR